MDQNTVVPERTEELHPRDKRTVDWICILVFIGASTIQRCLWSPERATQDYDKLVRIMYLFDSQACGYNPRASRAISNLQLRNDTGGLNVLPIKWMPAIVTVSTRLTTKTRRYMEISIVAHIIWLLVAIVFKVMHNIAKVQMLKLSLASCFYTSIFMVIFDLSMAIVYIAHIQQSLTKGMILRYSGWSVDMKLKNYEGFGAWLPIAASICWMRGIVFLAINIYCCRELQLIRRRIKKSEVKRRLILETEPAIPEAKYEEPTEDVLYYRAGSSFETNDSIKFFIITLATTGWPLILDFVIKTRDEAISGTVNCFTAHLKLFVTRFSRGLQLRCYPRLIFNSIEMATSLQVWTILLILYQTLFCVIISWLTLECRLAPVSGELQEVTLMKLLYFYDPDACGRIHFYNFTMKGYDSITSYTNILWPIKNPIASSFRRKMQIWMSVHIIWLFLSVINATQSRRSFSFYMTLLPFTLAGIAMLAIDITFTAMFLEDTSHTRNEVEILHYVNSEARYLRWISEMIPLDSVPNYKIPENEDTSWLSLMFAYASCRGIVQWIINFWVIKDNYFEGLSLYRRQNKERHKAKGNEKA